MKSLFTSALLISALAGGTAFAATSTKTPAGAQGHQVAQATTTTPASKDAKKATSKTKAAASTTTKKAKPAAAGSAPKTP